MKTLILSYVVILFAANYFTSATWKLKGKDTGGQKIVLIQDKNEHNDDYGGYGHKKVLIVKKAPNKSKPKLLIIKAPAPAKSCPPKIILVPKIKYITVPAPQQQPKVVVLPSAPVPPKVVYIKQPALPPLPPKVIVIKGPPAKEQPPKVIIQKVPYPVSIPEHGWRNY